MTSDYSALEATVAGDRLRALDWRDKAVVPAWYGATAADLAGTTTLSSLSTPLFTIDDGRVASNIRRMQRWCDERGLALAPHGKTTMAPSLWLRQLKAGSWGITVANEAQLRVARGSGVPRILLANLLLRPEALTWLSGELANDDALEVYLWADSIAAVEIMTSALEGVATRAPRVLVELGKSRARTGARSTGEALAVVEAVIESPVLEFAGIAGYEGAIDHSVEPAGLDNVDAYLATVLELWAEARPRIQSSEPILTLGGSTYFDRVALAVAPLVDAGTRVVLRSGAYVVHDDGVYRVGTPANRTDGPTLRPAIHAWARVISMPEPGRAYLDAGRRDLPFDQGLPEIQGVRKADGVYVPLAGYEIVELNDQHAFVDTPIASQIEVGDVLKLGLSHPCTSFDKWALIPVIDDSSLADPTVVDIIPTYF